MAAVQPDPWLRALITTTNNNGSKIPLFIPYFTHILYIYFNNFITYIKGVGNGGTALQIRRSLVRSQMVSWKFH
jgi:hypothetical protein